VIRKLKAELAGEIEASGPNLARNLTELGLSDEYQLYLYPFVFGALIRLATADRNPAFDG
jgi:riboflavin biosynthesis pyrimidine reductase